MNIQISGLPDNQKIKSINFNIVFDSLDGTCSMDFVPVQSVHTNTNTTQEQPKSKKIETTQAIEEKSEIAKPEDIDISNRVAKIDPNMLDETF